MEREIAHPVSRALGKIGDLAPFTGKSRCAKFVIEGEHLVVIGDVQRAIPPGEAGRRIETLPQDEPAFRNTVTIAIAQQHDLVGAFPPGPGLAEQETGNEIAEEVAFAAIDLGRAGQRDQDIAIRQSLQRARMIEPIGKPGDCQSLGSGRQFIVTPADRLGNRDRGNAFFFGFVERRVGAHRLVEGDIGGVAAREEIAGNHSDQHNDEERDAQFLEDTHGAGISEPRAAGNGA